jgi:hypothetical protein
MRWSVGASFDVTLGVASLPKRKTLSLKMDHPIDIIGQARLPILHRLELNVGRPRSVIDIINYFSGGLKVLSVFYGSEIMTERGTLEPPAFHFPHLHTVFLHNRCEEPRTTYKIFSASALNLRSCIEYRW